MAKRYKVHPGIGIARVGPSEDGYFLARESPDGEPIDIDANGNEVAFSGYKDSTKFTRRQGARFRVFEYEENETTGELSFLREITASEASIEWTVSLASSKSAGPVMTAVAGPDGKRTIVPSANFRNEPPTGFSRDDLIARVSLSASGVNSVPTPGSVPLGQVAGKDIYIGEARTDVLGRLVVLAGLGIAGNWVSPTHPLVDYLNNPGWYDDIADGPVDATITLSENPSEPIIADGAWIFTAPPDFAPDTTALTTLYDIAEQVSNIPLPSPLTYPQDIEPILLRAVNLYYVNERPVWRTIKQLMESFDNLSENDASAADNRMTVRDFLLQAEDQITDYRLTKRQKEILNLWVAGSFESSADSSRQSPSPPEILDRASLDQCVGGGFFPGIEAGSILRQKSAYSEFCRLSRGLIEDLDGSQIQNESGLISSRMACPWQADFIECDRTWWPAQRPDITGRNSDGSPMPDWNRGLVVGGGVNTPGSRRNMVDHFAQLGVVVKDGGAFAEVGRDPALDTGT